MKYSVVVLFVLITFVSFAQERLQPAKRYNEGESIFAPTIGLTTEVPKGWFGVLPRDTEIFLLMPLQGAGEIYVAADSISADRMKNGWLRGLDLGNGNAILSDGNITERNGAFASQLVLKKKTTNSLGYIEGKCSEFNRCVMAMLVAPPSEFEQKRTGVQELMDNIRFQQPTQVGLYDDFNWRENLSNKRLLHHTSIKGGQAQNEIRLCEDGTFFMNLKRKGALKEDAKQYKGKQYGTWETSSVGATGELILKFDKAQPDLTVGLKIDNDQIFLNNLRYFMMYGQTCR